MYLNGFSVRVHPGAEISGGYVELAHGTQYALRLRNQNAMACDAQVFVDGKDVGTFRLNAGASLPLERPSNDMGRFTFYRAASSEAQQSGIASISSQDYGLIRVVFTPEKAAERIVLVGYLDTQPAYFKDVTAPAYGALENVMASTAGALEDVIVSAGAAPTAGAALTDTTVYHIGSAGDTTVYNISSTGPFYPNATTFSAGITGLSGHSQQKFISVAPLDYDYTRQTTIYLRLVERSNAPRPIVSVATSIPPVVG